MICDENGEENQERKTGDMDGIFDLCMECFFPGKKSDDPVDDEKYESSAIESRKGKKIENPEIDADDRSDEQDNRESHFRIEETHEEISDGDRSAETLYRFRPLGGNPWRENPFYEGSEKFECHHGLSVGFLSSFRNGLEKPVFIPEILTNFRDIMSDETSDLPALGSHGKGSCSSGSSYDENKRSGCFLYFRDHIFRL